MEKITTDRLPIKPELPAEATDRLPFLLSGDATDAKIARLIATLNSVAARRCPNRWARRRLQDATQAALEAAACLQRDQARIEAESAHV